MTYPKQVTAQSLAAARERLLGANIHPDDQVYAENLAYAILEATSDDDWDAAEKAGPPCSLRCSRAELLAQFNDCEDDQIWHAIEMTRSTLGNSEGFKDRAGVRWIIFEQDQKPRPAD